MVVVYSHVLLFVIDVIGNYISRFEIEKSVHYLLKTEQLIKTQLHMDVNYKPLKNFVYFQLTGGIAIWTFFNVYYFVILCSQATTCIGNLLAYYIACQVSHVHVIQFCTLIKTITIFFKVINNKLNDISIKNQINLASVQGVQWVSKSQDDLNKELKIFILIRQIYDELYDISKKLNRAYSIQLLFTFANGFVVIFCSIYGTIFGYVFEGKVTDRADFKYILLPALLFVVAALKVLVVALACENLVNESQFTGVIIHKISLSTHQRAIKEVVSIEI